MQYTEVKIKVSTKDVETAAAIANMAVPYGIYIEDYSDIEEMAPKIAHIDLIEQELLERDRSHAVIHLYISPEQQPGEAIEFLRERLSSAGIEHELDGNCVDEEDWANEWKKYYVPVKIGKRLVVVPTWESYESGDGELILSMDPGMAFGTGTHETTRLCAGLVEQYTDENTRLLDVGTGSGILAVCAVLLGAENAFGVDIDETAVRVARENAIENSVQDKTRFEQGDLVSGITGTYNLVTANIVADVIIRLLPDLGKYLEPGGALIVSGIIDEREGDVLDALEQNGYAVEKRAAEGGWVAMSCRAV